MMEVLQGMRMTLYLKEALTGDIYPTVKGLPHIEDMERMDHLMEILVTMGHLVMADILQDVDHQDMDHQEEDHLVPLVHLEIWDPLDKEDHQEYLDLKKKEDILDPQDLKDHQDPQEE